MTRDLRGLAVAAVVLSSLLAARASAEPVESVTTRGAWSDEHWFGVGGRSLVRSGFGTESYTMLGIGGHARLAPMKRLHVELFFDNFAALGTDGSAFAQRHDHEIGFTLQTPLLEGRRFSLFPMAGACVVWSVASSNTNTATDLRFGVHGGLGGRVILGGGLAAHLELEAIAYNGHPLRTWGFSASVAPTLQWFGVVQGNLAFEYWF